MGITILYKQGTPKAIPSYLLLCLCIGLWVFASLIPSYAFGQIPFRILPCLIRDFDRPSYIEGECVIQFTLGTPETEKERIFIQYSLLPVYRSPYAGFDRVMSPPNQSVKELARILMQEPAILIAEPNYLAKADFIPNDPLFRYQWNMLQIKVDLAWNITNAVGIPITVLDSGAAYENSGIYGQAPDLAGTIFVPGWDFVNSDANPDDDLGHGTHITGTIAQTTNNALGCAGIAFGASITPIKVLDNTGYGSLTNIVEGIYYAANNKARIINMSFGFGNNPSLSLQAAIAYADAAGCLMVCSAGNEASNLPNYPASYPLCVSVSATIYDKTLASYSNYGAEIDLCAPGGDLTLDQNLDGYPDGILQQSHDGVTFTVFDYYSGKGTSWSCAHVSAVAAMVAAVGGVAMTPSQIRGVMESTAVDLGTVGLDQYFGWGLVDALAAIVATQQGAFVLSASPLLPFTPLLPTFTALPTATLAGGIAPFSPLSQSAPIQRTPSGTSYLRALWPQSLSASLFLFPPNNLIQMQPFSIPRFSASAGSFTSAPYIYPNLMSQPFSPPQWFAAPGAFPYYQRTFFFQAPFGIYPTSLF